jgi:ABC-type glycerol-3-phosphate transport system substrate-binding protein
MNPIDALDALSSADDFWYAPLTFGYLNYSRAGHPGRRLAFGDIPRIGAGPEPAGSLLGGAGLMISAYRPHRAEAAGYALHVAASATQRTTYLAAGGQPRTTTPGRTPPPTRLPAASSPAPDGPWPRPRPGPGRRASSGSRTR